MKSFKDILHCLWTSLCLAGATQAQDCLSQPVRIIAPYLAGTATDALSRVLAERLVMKWKQPDAVDNKACANEEVAAQTAMHPKPDGRTFLVAAEMELETNSFLFSNLPDNPSIDFTPITRLLEGPSLFAIRIESPYKTIQDLMAAGRKSPQSISYGSTGPRNSIHLAVNWVGAVEGAEFKQLPYRDISLAVQDVPGDIIDLDLSSPSVALAFVKVNQLRTFAIASPERAASFLDAPTSKERGYCDIVMIYMFGLVGPAKLPPVLAHRIATEATGVLKTPSFQARAAKPFGLTVTGGSSNDFVRYLAANRDKQRAWVQATNVWLG